MKVLIICGSHPRHRYLLDEVLSSSHLIKVVQMEREELLPNSDYISNQKVKGIFNRHFKDRLEIEQRAFGDKNVAEAYSTEQNIKLLRLKPSQLNNSTLRDLLDGEKFDIAVSMGPCIFDSNILGLLPDKHFNIHLGLSPWYRGSATLFWPTYNLEPWKCGVTFHSLNSETDAGGIYHQTKVDLHIDDGCHETAVRAISSAKSSVKDLFDCLQTETIKPIAQPFYGRTYLSSQIRPEHLWELYELRGNRTVRLLFDLGVEPKSFKIYSVLN